MAVKAYIPTESEEQQTLFSWAALECQRRHPELALLYHIPNGGARSRATAGRLKAEGVRAGVPDICLPVARGGYHALYIELKRVRGGRVSEKQEEMLAALAAQGNRCEVCKGWEAAKEAILRYLDSRQA